MIQKIKEQTSKHIQQIAVMNKNKYKNSMSALHKQSPIPFKKHLDTSLNPDGL